MEHQKKQSSWELMGGDCGSEVEWPFMNQEDVTMLLDSSNEPFSWFQEPFSAENSFLYLYEGFSDIGECFQATTIPSRETCKGEASGSRRNVESDDIDKLSRDEASRKKAKRTRSAAMHSVYERKRRDRIREKLSTLRELVPGPHKQDKASMLEDAAQHIKALKLQVEVMRKGGGTMWQTPPFMSQPGIPNVQIHQLPKFAHITPSPAMGMANSCHSLGPPMMPFPSACLPPSFSVAAGQHPMSLYGSLPMLQTQIPVLYSQPIPAVAASLAGISTAFNSSSQRDLTSRTKPSNTNNDHPLGYC